MKPQPRFKTTRCRCGACTNPALPAMPQCAACQRVATEQRRRRAKELAALLPHTHTADQVGH